MWNIGKAVQICQSATNVKVQICQSRAKCQSVKLVAAHLYKAAVVNVSVWQSAEKARGASLTNRRPTLLTHASLALERNGTKERNRPLITDLTAVPVPSVSERGEVTDGTLVEGQWQTRGGNSDSVSRYV